MTTTSRLLPRLFPLPVHRIGLALGLAIGALTLAGCATTTGGGSGPEIIIAERGGFIPEGIEYDNTRGRFLTGSLADGTVYEIGNDGRLSPVIEDPAIGSSVGIEVDESRNRLLVASTTMGNTGGAARLGAYDLGSGERLAMVDLAAAIENRPADASHFANDVAVSRYGVIFVTDTNMNIVYQVDRYYNASVLLDLGRESGLSLNGIEYHPAGYLLVAAMATGQLIKVPVNNPGNWSVVALDFPASGGDGLVWASDGGLVVTSNNTSSVLKYDSDDNWASARLVGMASFSGQGTTAAAVGDDIYVVQPHFGDDAPPVILRARF